ncbi:MAG: hypothetical protein M1834_007289 [Cirrosporium novae-zelandiae]|nr:MAG: hypothetical protein M1834_007289 [Cirrosporium novae-zelandiae]
MSAAVKKVTPPNNGNRRTTPSTPATASSTSRGTSKSPTPLNLQTGHGNGHSSTHSSTSSSHGVQRSGSAKGPPGSPISARAAARRPGHHTRSSTLSNVLSSRPDPESDENSRAETAALIEDLKGQLRKAESTSEEYLRQLVSLQSRLDDALKEQGRLEDSSHEKEEIIAKLEIEKKEAARQRSDAEQMFESEKASMIRDKEEQVSKEEELQNVIQRLKETLAQKEMRINTGEEGKLSRSSSFRNRSSPDLGDGQFAPSANIERSSSRASSKLILQKDKMIEALRLELAEAQIKLVEMENMGDGRLQALEKTLLETRMTNARLMEDNESFQLLLSEKTLNGDFSKADFMQESSSNARASGLGSLADELESATEGEHESENYRRIEAEAKSLKDQNKALTLYIERIIGRLLQHEGFETILDKSSDEPKADDVPPPPPPKDDEPAPSLLQRAKSVVSGTGRPNKPQRPMSQLPPMRGPGPNAHEDPSTAPSIPLNRGHRRTRSDMANNHHAASVVNHMYRGPSPAGGPVPPGPISPTSIASPRNSSFFSLPVNGPRSGSTPSSRAASGIINPGDRQTNNDASSESFRSEHSNGEVATNSSSPPRSLNQAKYTPAVMTQNKMRPLRLVQEAAEFGSGDQGSGHRGASVDETAARKANRGSWMGWFNRGKEEAAPPKVETVVESVMQNEL